jgi:hypothetical protein
MAIQGENDRNSVKDAQERVEPTEEWQQPAATRGHNDAETLDQESAMRREQRHICRGRWLSSRQAQVSNHSFIDKG